MQKRVQRQMQQLRRSKRRPRVYVTLLVLALVVGAAVVNAGWQPGWIEGGAAGSGGSGGSGESGDIGGSATGADTGADDLGRSTIAESGTALEVLGSLPVRGRAPKTDYDRTERFGAGWKDPDRNGCDARNDALRRDLASPVLDGPCTVLSGVLHDPYTGARIDFVRGEATSQAVQIDHVVALSDAWQKGALALTQEERQALANDPLNLLAVDGPTNSRKGDGDAATWLPPRNAFRCEYVARQVSVKAAYDLWVTRAERDAMRAVLDGCPAQSAYDSDFGRAAPAG